MLIVLRLYFIYLFYIRSLSCPSRMQEVCLPPLRFGAQPLAGQNGNRNLPLQAVRKSKPPGARKEKLNVQGPSQKRAQRVQKSSQPMARSKAKGRTRSRKLNLVSTRKVTRAAQSPLARDRRCSMTGHRLCRGIAPENGKLPQSSGGKCAGEARKRKVRLSDSGTADMAWVFRR